MLSTQFYLLDALHDELSIKKKRKKKRQTRFKLDFGSVPFQKLFPRELLQLIKQMIAKYSQCQPWQLTREVPTPSCSCLTKDKAEEQGA